MDLGNQNDFKYFSQAWTNCAPDADRVRSGAQNLWDVPDFSGVHILHFKKTL